jgi:hypothetical protein
LGENSKKTNKKLRARRRCTILAFVFKLVNLPVFCFKKYEIHFRKKNADDPDLGK